MISVVDDLSNDLQGLNRPKPDTYLLFVSYKSSHSGHVEELFWPGERLKGRAGRKFTPTDAKVRLRLLMFLQLARHRVTLEQDVEEEEDQVYK